MGIGRPPPVAERPISGTSIEKATEILSGLVVQGFLGTIHTQVLRVGRHPVGELVEVAPGRLEAGPRRADRRVQGPPRTPHLVLVADEVVTPGLQFKREGGNGLVPYRALENGTQPGLPEVLARQDRTAARRTRGRRNQRVGEQGALPGDAIEVGRFDQFVERIRAFVLGIGARVAAPIVGKGKQDVGFHNGGFLSRAQQPIVPHRGAPYGRACSTWSKP